MVTSLNMGPMIKKQELVQMRGHSESTGLKPVVAAGTRHSVALFFIDICSVISSYFCDQTE